MDQPCKAGQFDSKATLAAAEGRMAMPEWSRMAQVSGCVMSHN